MKAPASGKAASSKDAPSPQASVDVSRLLGRLYLQRRLVVASGKFVILWFYLLCFVGALHALQPAEDIGEAHRQLERHFALDTAAAVTDLDQVYAFARAFEERNAVLRATSGRYWCERRFFGLAWDDDLEVPVHTCASPRLSALGLSQGHVMPPAAAPLSSTATPLAGLCTDDDSALRRFTGQPSDLCNATAAWCGQAMTAGFCRQSCGYCGPFVYERMQEFASSQLAAAPAVLFQTRWVEKTCENFAQAYAEQGLYQALPTGSKVRGYTVDNALTCADRAKPLAKEHVLRDEPMPEHSVEFRGTPTFAELLALPDLDVDRLRNSLWLDGLTRTVTIATIVYSEHAEVFSYVAVEFKVDRAGGIEPDVQLKSYKEVRKYQNFLGCMFVAFILVVFSLLATILTLIKCKESRLCKTLWFEYFVQAATSLFIIILVVGWSIQDWMVDHYNGLLKAFVNMDGLADSGRNTVIAQFFDTGSEINDLAKYLFDTRVASYFLLAMMFAQVVIYFNVHPKIGIVALTARRGLCDMLHFGVIVLVALLLLGFCAHWVFGPYVFDYRTYSATMSQQLRWLCGEILVDQDARNHLFGARLFLYWFYALVFLVTVFWTLVFIFLAIVVDAFASSKLERDESEKITNSFFWDVAESLSTPLQHRMHGWPAQADIISGIEERRACWGDHLPLSEFCAAFPPVWPSNSGEIPAKDYLEYFNWKCSGAILGSPALQPRWPPAPEAAPAAPLARARGNSDPAVPTVVTMPSFPLPLPVSRGNSGAGSMGKEDTGPQPPEIPTLSEDMQRQLHARVEAVVLRRLEAAPATVEFEDLSALLACSVVQEVQQVLLETPQGDISAMGAPLPPGVIVHDVRGNRLPAAPSQSSSSESEEEV